MPNDWTPEVHPVVAAMIHRRDQTGESLQTVANRAGLSRSTLWKIEHGNDPQLSTLLKLAAALGCRLDIRLLRNR